jgi:hypothetical protein
MSDPLYLSEQHFASLSKTKRFYMQRANTEKVLWVRANRNDDPVGYWTWDVELKLLEKFLAKNAERSTKEKKLITDNLAVGMHDVVNSCRVFIAANRIDIIDVSSEYREMAELLAAKYGFDFEVRTH